MKLTLLTHYFANYQSLANIVLPNRQDYCVKHGYNSYVHCGDYYDSSWHSGIQRLKILGDYLFSSNVDFIWCLDIDAIIMNMTKPVTDYLDDNHDFFICRDCNGLNAGSFIIRKSEWSRNWLNFLIEKALTINHYWYENRVIHLYEKDPMFVDKIKDLPHPSINSYLYDIYQTYPMNVPGNYQTGDFVIHLPGKTLQERLDIFRSPRIQENIIY